MRLSELLDADQLREVYSVAASDLPDEQKDALLASVVRTAGGRIEAAGLRAGEVVAEIRKSSRSACAPPAGRERASRT